MLTDIVYNIVRIIPPWYVLLFIVVELLFWHSVKDFGMFDKYGFVGPRPYPFIGCAWPILRKGFHEYDRELFETYKEHRVCRVFEFGVPALLILDMKLAKEILIKEFALFTNRKKLRKREPPLDRSLVEIRDDHWRHVRNKISPTFSGAKLKNMMPLIQKTTKSLDGVFGKYAESGESMDAKEVFSAYIMDIISSTMFGLDVDSLNNPDHPFVKRALGLLSPRSIRMKVFIFLTIALPSLLKALQKIGLQLLDNDTVNFFTKHLQRTLAERRDSPEDFHDFVAQMIDVEVSDDTKDTTCSSNQLQWSSKGLTHDDIIAQMFIFLVGGFEPTSNALLMTVYNIAIYEDMQIKLQDEVDSVLGDEEPNYENIHKLEYLDMFINESTRLYGPAPRVLREASEDVEIDGIFIPKGVAVWVPMAAIHRNPDLYPDPLMFNPERFSAEEKAKRDPASFMPFGLGPRHCVAKRLAELVMRVGLAKILQKWTLSLDESSPREIKIAKTRMIPETPLKLKIARR